MKRAQLLLLLFLVVLNIYPALSQKDYLKETKLEKDQRLQWWRDATFGMFVHWGVYSVPAGIYKGKSIDGIGEWIMEKGKIPIAEYEMFAKQFDPKKFDAK